jgi:hypothetical protein
LADFPADGHALENGIFEDEISGVIAFGEELIFVQRFGHDDVVEDVVLHGLESEVALRNGGEILDPIGNRQTPGCHLLIHGAPPKGNPEIRWIAEEL